MVACLVNGKRWEGEVEPRTTLADLLREEFGLTGTHLGCEQGVCGSCTVLLDRAPVRSCLVLAAQADGATVLTVEGLAKDDQLHPLQLALAEEGGLQCGFCTPGILTTAVAILDGRPSSVEEIAEALSGNLCRCTGYVGIINAVARVAGIRGRRHG
jgi:carbon-monoxide dehydrogenase small subunit